jgi:hypothetical protein
VNRAGRVPLLGPAVVKRLGRQTDARGSERADYLVVQSVTRYEETVLAGELAQLAHGIAEGSHLHLGEATDLSHGTSPARAPSGSSTHDHTRCSANDPGVILR